jgi:mono/diheme cytochrome c family protein
MMRTIIYAIAGLALSIPLAATAQGVSIGEREYMSSCAQCHGADGRGDGVMAGFLTSTVPDLSGLQAANNGVFPVTAVYGIIDGSAASGVHGTAEMPAWGDRYMAQSPRMLGEYYGPEDQEAFVRGRILALIEYISTLQQ